MRGSKPTHGTNTALGHHFFMYITEMVALIVLTGSRGVYVDVQSILKYLCSCPVLLAPVLLAPVLLAPAF